MTEADIRADERQRIAKRLRDGASGQDSIAETLQRHGDIAGADIKRTRAEWLRQVAYAVEQDRF